MDDLLDHIQFGDNTEYIENYAVAGKEWINEEELYGDNIIENPAINPTEFDDCYLSLDELKELSTPSVQKWKDQKVKASTVKFSIDSCKLRAWNLAKKEIYHVRSRLLVLLKKSDNEGVSNEEIFNYLFGEESALAKVLMKELDIDFDTLMKFFSTMVLQAAYRTTVTETFDKNSSLAKDAVMIQQDYVKVWEKIANYHRQQKDNYFGQGRREGTLWEKLERVLNDTCVSISITNRRGHIPIALDDDKIWLYQSGKNKEDSFNLNYTTHVRDNRKGLIAHTAVSSGVNLPLGLVAERKGESAFICFKRLLNQMFGSNTGECGNADLQNVEIASDRGYMTPSLVFLYLLACGSQIVGTVKRALCWPYTYSQKITKSNDKRTLLDVKGAPTLFLKCIKHTGRTVTASAFRNGSDSVSTTISTIHRGYHWEGIGMDWKECKVYRDDPQKLKGETFPRLIFANELVSDDEADAIESIKNDVYSLTLRQGTADWHLGRKFSLTSSQGHFIFIHAFPLYKERSHWRNVAIYLYGPNWKKCLNIPEDESSTDEMTISSSSQDGGECQANDEDTDSILNNEITCENTVEDCPHDSYKAYFLRVVPSGEIETAAHSKILETLNNADVNNIIDDEIKIFNESSSDFQTSLMKLLIGFVDETKQKRVQARTYQTEFKKWIGRSNEERQFMFHSKKALQGLATERGVPLASVDAMITSLASLKLDSNTNVLNERESESESDSDSDCVNVIESWRRGGEQRGEERGGQAQRGVGRGTARGNRNRGNGRGRGRKEKLYPKKVAIKAMLEKSFQGRQLGQQREHCSLGHFLETPIFLSFLNDINQGEELDSFTVLSAYTAGLVAKTGKPWAKDSVDFVATVETSMGFTEAWPIEIKSRVTVKSAVAEREFNESIDREKYERINQKEVHKMVKEIGERHQLIHHCYVYNKLTGALIIGDKQSQVIQATVVDYGCDLLDDYGQVLEDMKEDFLQWLYDEDYDGGVLAIPREVIEIAKEIGTIRTEETLIGTAKLWRKMFDDASKLPLPSLARIIPIFHAYWNAVKSGSDTTTMLVDKCASLKSPVPHTNCNSRMCGRIIMVLLVLFHRLKSINTSKDDLDSNYPTLAHFRNAATRRSSFHQTLLWCMQNFKKMYREKVVECEREEESRPNHIQQIDGILQHRLEFASKETFKTPKKRIVQRMDDGELDQDVKKRWEKCTGFPVRVYRCKKEDNGGQTKDDRRYCAICGTRAKFFCIGCRAFFCLEGKDTKCRKQEFFCLPTKKEDGTRGDDRIFEKSCYHKKHADAYEAMVRLDEDFALEEFALNE